MYGLSFSQVSEAIRRESVNIPAGLIRSDVGEIMVRTIDQKYTGQQMKSIVLRANLMDLNFDWEKSLKS